MNDDDRAEVGAYDRRFDPRHRERERIADACRESGHHVSNRTLLVQLAPGLLSRDEGTAASQEQARVRRGTVKRFASFAMNKAVTDWSTVTVSGICVPDGAVSARSIALSTAAVAP